ncbi:MAG TPA: hypothetical protein VFS00_07845, partial [Polyangiaceae bacterium]|nr:hypothetical protein [Polyangiaceae bacterium]
PREVWSAGLRVLELDVAEAGATEIVGVAARALRDGTSTFVVALERGPGQGGVYDVVLRPTTPRQPVRRVRFEGPPGWRPRGPFVAGGRVIVVDEQRVARSIGASSDLEVSSFALAAPAGVAAGGAATVVGDGLLALEVAGGGLARWALFDAATGEARGELCGPRLCQVPGAEGTTFYRVSGALGERLDAAGGAADRFELPSGVSPLAVVESPLGGPPVVLAPWPGRPEVALWWQTPERIFRSFALFEGGEQGGLIEALTFPGRALCAVTRRAGGAALLHTVWAERGTLRARRYATEANGHAGLVTDPSGRRGWAVRRDEQGGTLLDPINLRVDDA